MLARSAVLTRWEAQLAGLPDRVEPIVGRLARKGRLAVTSGTLPRSITESLAARARAAGRVDTRAKTDPLWDHPNVSRCAPGSTKRGRSASAARRSTASSG